ncbi:MAG: flagellar basal body P-ring formation chaperone FlgA, partial [Pseudomonadota bacterium]
CDRGANADHKRDPDGQSGFDEPMHDDRLAADTRQVADLGSLVTVAASQRGPLRRAARKTGRHALRLLRQARQTIDNLSRVRRQPVIVHRFVKTALAIRIALVVGVGTAIALGFGWPAHSQEQTRSLMLMPEITVASDVVTIGDLLGVTGETGQTPVFRAPKPGMRGTIATDQVIAALAQHGVTGIESGGLAYVSIGRTGQRFTADDLVDAVLGKLVSQGMIIDPETAEVVLEATPEDLYATTQMALDAAMTLQRADVYSGRFRAEVMLDPRLPPTVLAGRFRETRPVVTLTRAVERGTVISARDLTITQMNRIEVPADAMTDPEPMVGKAARRTLSAGSLLDAGDLMTPILVERNQDVTLVYRAAGIVLSSRGRALSDAGQGETVSVVNSQSRRTVQGVVTAPGVVEFSANAAALTH